MNKDSERQVLVVDDDVGVRQLLARLLTTRFKAKVRVAENGSEGLVALAEAVPTLIVLDVDMPVMNGPEMLEQMRASELFSTIPVVTISASDDRDMVSQMIKLGVVDYLLKPLNITSAQARLTRIFKALETTGRRT